MHLEKLTIQGFKSFAHKNELHFKGMMDGGRRGITAIVGPNGSGKSNVADAVRWTLGEQSMKSLRGKKAEDVIFSGTEKKGKLGMAEVSLYLNNEDKQAPIDYSEVVITRRLYRNGESEYLINNNRVRLSDIQMLLARAKFGQKTYSVIGQGMVEGFLNTSLAERKEFFDEATGVKQYQIKRDESLNKLRGGYENLGQTEMLLTEIEPRLKSLTRQVNRLQRRGELEKELYGLQSDYYGNVWHEFNSKFTELNSEYLELEKVRGVKDGRLGDLNKKLEQLKTESQKDNDFSEWQIKLTREQSEKDNINRRLNKLEAQIEMKLEAQGKFDLSFLLSKKEELAKGVMVVRDEMHVLESGMDEFTMQEKIFHEEKKLNDEKIAVASANIEKINREIQDRIKAAGVSDGAESINKKLNSVLLRLDEATRSDDVMEIKKTLREVEIEIRKVLAEFNKDGEKEIKKNPLEERWQEMRNIIADLTREREIISSKISNNHLKSSAQKERIKLLAERVEANKRELSSIEMKLNQRSDNFDFGDLQKEQAALKDEIVIRDEIISSIKTEINKINERGAEKRNQLFAIQKDLQDLQHEVNQLNNRLNDIKVAAARAETKLEDLEIEIREEFGDLKMVREKGAIEDLDVRGTLEKIRQTKKQLELIGGIDPAIEEEYRTTKERFDFLHGQHEDFQNTVRSLEKVIRELDEVIRKQFDKEFGVIAKNFEKYFKMLFNGGVGKIIKVMEQAGEGDGNSIAKMEGEKEEKSSLKEDMERIKFLQRHNATGLAGIEIQACPPGKKISSISMLSGGERALTAVALISAIISSNPSPFVVLDEVDAALDEANSERLASILDELSHKTQFIVITHNRASMRKANILYGVTMGDDGVSKLLSVKLDEVRSSR